jgi:hypothetical protein
MPDRRTTETIAPGTLPGRARAPRKAHDRRSRPARLLWATGPGRPRPLLDSEPRRIPGLEVTKPSNISLTRRRQDWTFRPCRPDSAPAIPSRSDPRRPARPTIPHISRDAHVPTQTDSGSPRLPREPSRTSSRQQRFSPRLIRSKNVTVGSKSSVFDHRMTGPTLGAALGLRDTFGALPKPLPTAADCSRAPCRSLGTGLGVRPSRSFSSAESPTNSAQPNRARSPLLTILSNLDVPRRPGAPALPCSGTHTEARGSGSTRSNRSIAASGGDSCDSRSPGTRSTSGSAPGAGRPGHGCVAHRWLNARARQLLSVPLLAVAVG